MRNSCNLHIECALSITIQVWSSTAKEPEVQPKNTSVYDKGHSGTSRSEVKVSNDPDGNKEGGRK